MKQNSHQDVLTKDKELLPLTSDIVFKRVFSREGNEHILKALLEAILEIKIRKVTVKNPQLAGDLIDSKAGILDIKVEIDENTICDVEMQVKDEKNIDSRSTYYMAKILSDEIKKGEEYIKVKKTIVINLLNFNFYKRNSYHNIAHMKFEKTKVEEYIDMGYTKEDEIVTKDLEMHFIEIPKFIKKHPGIDNKLEQWLWVIAGGKEQIEMAKKENTELKEVMEILEGLSMDSKEWEMYESRRLAILDYNTGMEQARIDGEEAGVKKGIKERSKRKKYRNCKRNEKEEISIRIDI